MVKRPTVDSVRKAAKRGRHVAVDISGRLKRSFGNPVQQKIEAHYRGKPLSFNYTGNMETVTIDVIHQEQKEREKANKGPAMEVEQFDASRRRQDVSVAYFGCSCGVKFKGSVATTLVESGNSKLITKGIREDEIKAKMSKHQASGHTVTLLHTDSQIEVLPEETKIKNFSQEGIRYYRLFSDKSAEIKYFVSYNQDILAEAPQYRYSETSEGKSYMAKQNGLFMVFLVAMVMIVEYFSVQALVYSSLNYTPHSGGISIAWYLLLAAIIGMGGAMWRLHIHDVGNQSVKYMMLEPAPFYISNRGILPVILTNSALNTVWDYQSKVMQVDDSHAKEVFYSLQSWTDEQIAYLYRANQLGKVEHELSVINTQVADITKLDIDYRTGAGPKSASRKQIGIAIAITSIFWVAVLILIQ